MVFRYYSTLNLTFELIGTTGFQKFISYNYICKLTFTTILFLVHILNLYNL